MPGTDEHTAPQVTRRRVLVAGIGAVSALVVAGVTGVELVEHGVLPGKQTIDRLDGACSVPDLALSYDDAGPSASGTFYSHARFRTVGYTIAFPPAHDRGDDLPLVVMLHGYGSNHTDALVSTSPARALAMRVNGAPLPPMAMVTVDGGGHYWNPHPGDDPMRMVMDELIPLCQEQGLGRPPHGIGAMGISMGGYGALLLAEKYPRTIRAVAAISPAIWTTYDEARGANDGAFASASAFDADNVITHASALSGTPVRVVSGENDPFQPGVSALVRGLPAHAVTAFPTGCHTDSFFASQEPPSLAFLARHLAA